MANISQKKNLSSMQVFKTLQVLLQGEYTMQELVTILNSNESKPIFNNSVISKYINTCRYCGIQIPKIHNKYILTSIPFGLNFTNFEIELLSKLQQIAKEEFSTKRFKILQELISKINILSNKPLIRLEKDSLTDSFEQFENAVTDRKMVRLMLKNKVNITGIPIKINSHDKKVFFNIFYKNRERRIDIDRVAGIEILQEKFIRNFNNQTVVYMLRGDLVKRYTLKENERIINQSDETITISNNGEDRESLFARLLQYDNKCEIINPKEYRIAMKQIIEDALLNYGDIL